LGKGGACHREAPNRFLPLGPEFQASDLLRPLLFLPHLCDNTFCFLQTLGFSLAAVAERFSLLGQDLKQLLAGHITCWRELAAEEMTGQEGDMDAQPPQLFMCLGFKGAVAGQTSAF
jgi:hypothetical protein